MESGECVFLEILWRERSAFGRFDGGTLGAAAPAEVSATGIENAACDPPVDTEAAEWRSARAIFLYVTRAMQNAMQTYIGCGLCVAVWNPNISIDAAFTLSANKKASSCVCVLQYMYRSASSAGGRAQQASHRYPSSRPNTTMATTSSRARTSPPSKLTTTTRSKCCHPIDLQTAQLIQSRQATKLSDGCVIPRR